MTLQTLVEYPSITVQVQSLERRAVCRKCKGGGTVNVLDYYNQKALWHGGLLAISHASRCPLCDGRGHWVEP